MCTGLQMVIEYYLLKPARNTSKDRWGLKERNEMRDFRSIPYRSLFTMVLSSLKDQRSRDQKSVKEGECSGLNRFENIQKKL
jgi:hypothetical protein